MRLTSEQHNVIVRSIRACDPEARIYLFGSRVEDHAKGGDIDILIISDKLGFRDLWPIRRDILDEMGWQKLDLIVRKPDQLSDAIAVEALNHGECL